MMATGIAVTRFVEHVGVPLAVAIIGIAGTIAAAALSFAFGRWNDSASRRREGYSAATRQLVAYLEYPYRIRRRTSDSPDDLARLAAIGHDLQEALRYHETWIGAENAWVATIYRQVRHDLAAVLAPACHTAWNSPPITNAADMTLGGWGPQGADQHIERFEAAVTFRFGWRRVLAAAGWRPGAKPRPQTPLPVRGARSID
jgi:hypothetical protein